MKITPKNLELLRYDRIKKVWYHRKTRQKYIYKRCTWCNEPFLMASTESKIIGYCSRSCSRKQFLSNPVNRSKAVAKLLEFRKINDYIGENNPFFGHKHTEETKMHWSKIRANAKRPPHSQQAKEKIGLANSGENNGMYGRLRELASNWQGGKSSEPYGINWIDREWRDYIKDRDKEKFCWNSLCNNNGKLRTLHHIDYNKRNCSFSNIITICNSCNARANYNRLWWEEFYIDLIKNRGINV